MQSFVEEDEILWRLVKHTPDMPFDNSLLLHNRKPGEACILRQLETVITLVSSFQQHDRSDGMPQAMTTQNLGVQASE